MKLLITLILITTVPACGKNAKEVLQSKGRPEPITCAHTAESQNTCTDGDGVVWTCGYIVGGDDECIATGLLPSELPR